MCSGAIIPSSPPDFYNLSAIITGNTGTLTTAAALNAKIELAKSSKGWCVFLTHGIDSDGGYSPTQSTELAGHLAYVNTHGADYWVATFAEVVKYIKERNALAVAETTVSADALSLTVTDNLPDAVYNVPVTVRRQLPATWQNAAVTLGTTPVPSTITTVGTVKYLVFDVVPDQGVLRLTKATALATTQGAAAVATSTWPNPFVDRTTLAVKGSFHFAVYSVDGKLVESGEGTDTAQVGGKLASGAYLVKVSQLGKVSSSTIIKK